MCSYFKCHKYFKFLIEKINGIKSTKEAAKNPLKEAIML